MTSFTVTKWILAVGSCMVLMSCTRPNARDLGCDVALDTTLVDGPVEHGVWLVADSLYLFGGFRPFNPSVCVPLWAATGLVEGSCALAEVPVPFAVRQTGKDDTLHVIKGGQTFAFQLDEAYCSDSEW
ncbi:hypothetical protein [Rubricoccus marinus]|uniref:Uncharacterized protein n=1 Tax=Rubricoccus marinus TaxID=716817 RepID=A0A259TXW7_9BACT|nr:hypothetical protein [Rubricoccus marinus]OZC02536.1 hypothetical protein BSZ36_05830 [Rubricoccus marinus]